MKRRVPQEMPEEQVQRPPTGTATQKKTNLALRFREKPYIKCPVHSWESVCRLLKEIWPTAARFPLKIQQLSFQRVVFRQLNPNRRHCKKSGAETNARKLCRKSHGGLFDSLQNSLFYQLQKLRH
jgi:hypothetical protein